NARLSHLNGQREVLWEKYMQYHEVEAYAIERMLPGGEYARAATRPQDAPAAVVTTDKAAGEKKTEQETAKEPGDKRQDSAREANDRATSLKEIAEEISVKFRDKPISREEFEKFFERFPAKDRKIAQQIVEQSIPNMTSQGVDAQMLRLK